MRGKVSLRHLPISYSSVCLLIVLKVLLAISRDQQISRISVWQRLHAVRHWLVAC